MKTSTALLIAGGVLLLAPEPEKPRPPQVLPGDPGHPTVKPGEIDYVLMWSAQRQYAIKRYGVTGGNGIPLPPLGTDLARTNFYWWWREVNRALGWVPASSQLAASGKVAPDGGTWTGTKPGGAFDDLVREAKRFWDDVTASMIGVGEDGVLIPFHQLTLEERGQFWGACQRIAIALDADRHTPDFSGEIWGDAVDNLRHLPGKIVTATGQVVDDAAVVAGTITGSVLDGLLQSPTMLALTGVTIYFVTRK